MYSRNISEDPLKKADKMSSHVSSHASSRAASCEPKYASQRVSQPQQPPNLYLGPPLLAFLEKLDPNGTYQIGSLIVWTKLCKNPDGEQRVWVSCSR